MEGQVVYVAAYSKLKPECINQAQPVLTKLFEATKKEEGCLFCEYYEDVKELGFGLTLEIFKNMEAFQAHMNSEHIKEATPALKEWAAVPTVVRILKPLNVWAESKDTDIKITAIITIKDEFI